MAENIRNDGYSPDLVPVQTIIPETSPHSGAVMIMKNGSFRMILKVGSVNFEMQSVREQIGTIKRFGGLLDSLEPTAPIQIFCHTKRLDSEAYIRQFDFRLRDPNLPPLIRQLIEARIQTFKTFVDEKNLLQREFYIVIAYRGIPEPAGESLTDTIPGVSMFRALFGTIDQKAKFKEPSDIDVDIALQQLGMRAQNVEGWVRSIGITHVERLDQKGILRLLANLYNPGLAEKQRPAHMEAVGQYMPTLPDYVQRAMNQPSPPSPGSSPRQPMTQLPEGNPIGSTVADTSPARGPVGHERLAPPPIDAPPSPQTSSQQGRRRRKQDEPPASQIPPANMTPPPVVEPPLAFQHDDDDDDDTFSGPPPLI